VPAWPTAPGLVTSLSAQGRDPSPSCRGDSIQAGTRPQSPVQGGRRRAGSKASSSSSSGRPHRDPHTAAVGDPAGVVLVQVTVATTTIGHRQLLGWAQRHASGPWVGAVEGTGSFGAGLTRLLADHGELVVEVDRPKRPARGNGATSEALDAARAARRCSPERIWPTPRRGDREAMRGLLPTRRCAVAARTRPSTSSRPDRGRFVSSDAVAVLLPTPLGSGDATSMGHAGADTSDAGRGLPSQLGISYSAVSRHCSARWPEGESSPRRASSPVRAC
jgi:hypothetical protein